MITRRRFLIGAAGIATIPFNFYETAYAFFQNHSEPLLIPPKEVRETLYLCWGNGAASTPRSPAALDNFVGG